MTGVQSFALPISSGPGLGALDSAIKLVNQMSLCTLLLLSSLSFCLCAEEDGSGEESGSGCDSPSCDNDDMYFSTPVPVQPRMVHQEKDSSSGVRLAPSSLVLALAVFTLALLAPNTR